MEHLRNLLTEKKEIAIELRKRQKTYIERTIRGSTKEILQEKIDIEEKDGWRFIKKRKKSCRIAKDKPVDEKLEDELWSIVARCGFDELSKGRNFEIPVGPEVNPRQIDVFAKDHETVICIECTSALSPKKKRLDSLIEKIISIRPKAMESVNAHYGEHPKLKIRWVIATRDIDWGGDTNLRKASAENIVVLRDAEIDYFTKLTKQYKQAAKYQLLAHIFKEEEIRGMRLKVLANRGHMGGQTFYNFLINPSDLLKIAYISHKSKDLEDLETYQRMLSPKRLKRIAKYIDKGGQFPTNIVINIKNKGRKLNFEGKEKFGDSAIGVLSLPNRYASAWVIDGQHRLYGYTQSKRALIPTDKTTFPVLAYENLPSKNESKLFVDINHEQVRVNKNLLMQIYSGLRWDSDDLGERIDSLCSRVVLKLNKNIGSPINDRIKTDNKPKTNIRCLTLTSFCEGIIENKLFGDIKPAGFSPGPLWDSNSKEIGNTLNKAYSILFGYLNKFANNLPEHWNIGDDKGGYLSTNSGIRALLGVIKEIFLHLKTEHHIDVDLNDAEDLLVMSEKYIAPIVEFFKNCSPDEIKPFRERQALHGVRQNIFAILSIVHRSDLDFKPAGLMEYLSNIDEAGTSESIEIINQIVFLLFSVTTEVLKRKFGDNWWYEKIPESVRMECSKSREKDKGNKEIHQYLNITDYKTIAMANWETLKDYFALEEGGNREKQLNWLVRLNEIRNITHHREKWPANKEQIAFIRTLYPRVINKFNINKNSPDLINY